MGAVCEGSVSGHCVMAVFEADVRQNSGGGQCRRSMLEFSVGGQGQGYFLVYHMSLYL